MKLRLLVIALVLLMALPLMAAPPKGGKGAARTILTLDNKAYIDANNIFMFVTNQGSFGRDLAGVFGYDYGTFFPYNGIQFIEDGSQIRSPLYASGLWIGGVDSAAGDIRVKVAEYNSEYWQGPWETATTFVDKPEYKVYKLYSDSLEGNPNADYTNWPRSQGAPVTAGGKPAMIGDQMCWTVYHDRNDTLKANDAGRTKPLGVEIRQTTFAFRREGPLNNIIFIKFQIFNRGGHTIDSTYFSLWADPDLGDANDDLVGCDTALSVGFVYNSNNHDTRYGSNPPSLGYDFFQGPLMKVEDTNSIAKAWGKTWHGYKSLGMVSFNKYINGTDPNDFHETYNYMRGLQSNGQPLENGTKYMAPGDPVAGTGDLDIDPADRRLMLSTGPIIFRPNDSVEILAAIVVGQGGDRKSSISVMKYFDVFAQSAYDLDFQIPKPPVAPQVTLANLDNTVSLRWNDTSEVDPGDYPFQGYTVYQGTSPAGPWKQIANYDLIDGESNILDNVLDPLTGILEYRAVKVASDNGVKRYYGTSEDMLLGGELNNITKYFYKVEAYSYNRNKVPKTLTSATIVTTIPQSPLAGVKPEFRFGDTIPVEHRAGKSDGKVMPEILDPLTLTGHTYFIRFKVNDTGLTTWDLVDSNLSVVLLHDQVNQTADNNYTITDGMIVRVSGPPKGLKPGEPGDPDQGWAARGTRRFTQAGGADGFKSDLEGFRGTAGWNSPCYFFGNCDARGVAAGDIKSITLKLATVADNGTFSPTDENVSFGYRYGRGFQNPPAKPEFGPYIVNSSASYAYQDFTKSVPLSVWNTETTPPTRLAVGFLENNVEGGLVDGKYWPPYYSDANNTDGAGPREWLFIFNAPYTTTPDTAFEHRVSTTPLPIMYMATWARRQAGGWATGDEFDLYANHINLPADLFYFKALAPLQTHTESDLSRINTVPNPYYLFGPYDPAATNRQIKFQHLPKLCTIRIYNLAGELIRTIRKTDQTTSLETWDVLTENGLPVGSGIYIYVVDADGFGQKIGKMAVFTEAEVIRNY